MTKTKGSQENNKNENSNKEKLQKGPKQILGLKNDNLIENFTEGSTIDLSRQMNQQT